MADTEIDPIFEILWNGLVEKGSSKTITLEHGLRHYSEIPEMAALMGPLLDQTMLLINKWLEQCGLLANPHDADTFQSLTSQLLQKALKKRGY